MIQDTTDGSQTWGFSTNEEWLEHLTLNRWSISNKNFGGLDPEKLVPIAGIKI